MANREERQLARQRGAGTHKVNPSGFSISIPIGPPPALSAPNPSKTPLQTQSQAPQLSAARSLRKRDAPQASLLKPVQTPAARGSALKGSKIVGSTLTGVHVEAPRSILKDGPSARDGRKRKSTGGEDGEVEDVRNVSFADDSTVDPTPSFKRPKLDKRSAKSSETPASASRVASKSSNTPSRSTRPKASAVAASTPIPRGRRRRQASYGTTSTPEQAAADAPFDHELENTSPSPRRDSALNASFSTDSSLASIIESAKASASQATNPSDRRQSLRAVPPPVSRAPLAPLPSNRPMRVQKPAKAQPAQPKTVAKAKSKPGKTRKKRTAPTSAAPAVERSAVPITVYRFPKTRQDPSTADADSDQENVPPPSGPPIPTRPSKSANPIDVLSQLCREVINASISRLKNPAPPAPTKSRSRQSGVSTSTSSSAEAVPPPTKSKSLQKARIAALERFGEELDLQLLRMSEVLDGVLVLSKQLRERRAEVVRKERVLLELKLRREAVRNRIKDVRFAHEVDDIEGRKWEGWNRVAEGAGLFVEGVAARKRREENGEVEEEVDGELRREWEDEQRGLVPLGIEARIEDLKRVVCCNVEGEETGILKRVKDFNAFLGRIVDMDVSAMAVATKQ